MSKGFPQPGHIQYYIAPQGYNEVRYSTTTWCNANRTNHRLDSSVTNTDCDIVNVMTTLLFQSALSFLSISHLSVSSYPGLVAAISGRTKRLSADVKPLNRIVLTVGGSLAQELDHWGSQKDSGGSHCGFGVLVIGRVV